MLNNTDIPAERFVKAATLYLSQKGYMVETAQEAGSIDLVAASEHDGIIALVALVASEEGFDDSRVLSRAGFEDAMLALAEGDMFKGWENMQIRFDTICIRAIGGNALLRHRINAPLF